MKQILENAVNRSRAMLDLQSRPVVGLDIGPDAVKMVSLVNNGDGCQIAAVAMSEIDSVDDSKGPSRIAILAAIEECLKSGGESISRDCYFVLGLAGPMVKISSFNFASLTLDEVAQAVMFEAAQVCPFDIRNSVVDYQLMNIDITDADLFKKKNKNKTHPSIKGVLAVAAKEEVARKQQLAKDALLKCVLMDSDGLALLNCIREYLPEDELPVAVVNINRSITTVAILGDDGIPFIRDLKYCGNDILDHVAKSCGIGIDQAERPEDFAADIARACQRLVLDINETLTYHSIHHSTDAVRCVYVCGDFSLLDNFVRVLADSIDNKVSVWNPFLNMNCGDDIVGGDLIGKCGPALAVATGLAMRQV